MCTTGATGSPDEPGYPYYCRSPGPRLWRRSIISGKLYAAIVGGIAAVIVVADYLGLGRGATYLVLGVVVLGVWLLLVAAENNDDRRR